MEASSKPTGQTAFQPAKVGSGRRGFKRPLPLEMYDRRLFEEEAAALLRAVADAPTLAEARDRLSELVLSQRIQNSMSRGANWNCRVDRVRDCARVLLINGRTGQMDGARRASMKRAWRRTLIIGAVALLMLLVSLVVAGAGLIMPPLAVVGGIGALVALLTGLGALVPVARVWQFNRRQDTGRGAQ